MLSISGHDFFRLPRTGQWWLNLVVNIAATLGMVAFVICSMTYNSIEDPDSPELRRIVPLGAFGIFMFLCSVGWASSNLCHGVQTYRGIHSMYLRLNSIYTCFIALLYTLLSLMEYGQPIVYMDSYSGFALVCLVPLVVMVVLKLFIGYRLIRRRLPRLGGAILLFWSLFVATCVAVLVKASEATHDVFTAPVTALVVVTILAGVNMMFRYSASSLILSYYPREYEKDLERYNRG